MLTDITDCQTSKGIPGCVDECVVGVDEFVVAEPYCMILERVVLEELLDEVVATGVQVEQSELSDRGRTPSGDVSFVTRFLDGGGVDSELLELGQIVQYIKECPRSNIRYVEPNGRQGVRDRPKHLSDGGQISLRRASVRNELGDLEGLQCAPTIRREVFRYRQNLICVPVVRIFAPHE